MAGRRASRGSITRQQWVDLINVTPASDVGPSRSRRDRLPISRQRIVDGALQAIRTNGYDRLTMRTVADALDTGVASLYQHVRNKSQLGDLLVGELCSRIELPTPDPMRWQDQFLTVCTQLRDQLLDYPGLAQAAMAALPADLATLRVGETLFTLLLTAGATPQDAAWTSDAAYLYVIAYCIEDGLSRAQSEDAPEEALDRAEITERLRLLPNDQFPNTVRYAQELTAGEDHARFDHTLRLMLNNLQTIGA